MRSAMMRQSILARRGQVLALQVLALQVLALMMLAALIVPAAAIAQERSQIEIVPNTPHQGYVRASALSPDGTRLVSANGDEIKLWDLASGQLIRQFLGHLSHVYSVAFSPDGTRLLSGSE